MTEKLTACKECGHKRNFKDHDGHTLHRCHAQPLAHFNYLHGKMGSSGYRLCGSVNTDGHCPHFEQKGESQ